MTTLEKAKKSDLIDLVIKQEAFIDNLCNRCEIMEQLTEAYKGKIKILEKMLNNYKLLQASTIEEN